MKKTNLKVRNMKVGWKEDTRAESAAGSMAHHESLGAEEY